MELKEKYKHKGLQHVIDVENPMNKFIYSELCNMQIKSRSEGISIKYVYDGVETYIIDGERFDVHPNNFLIVNHDHEVEVDLVSDSLVKGICLYVDPKQLSALDWVQNSSTEEKLEHPFKTKTNNYVCRELIYPSKLSPLHNFIQQVLSYRSQFTFMEKNRDWFYELTLLMWEHENQVSRQVNNIEASKKSTKEELFRRLILAVEYIHDHLSQKISIKDLAKAAMLSEFHFLRTFKQFFDISPNQYIIRERMNKAAALLKGKQFTIGEVADLCGFSDVQYFGKTFKRTFGQRPSEYMRTAV